MAVSKTAMFCLMVKIPTAIFLGFVLLVGFDKLFSVPRFYKGPPEPALRVNYNLSSCGPMDLYSENFHSCDDLWGTAEERPVCLTKIYLYPPGILRGCELVSVDKFEAETTLNLFGYKFKEFYSTWEERDKPPPHPVLRINFFNLPGPFSLQYFMPPPPLPSGPAVPAFAPPSATVTSSAPAVEPPIPGTERPGAIYYPSQDPTRLGAVQLKTPE